MLHVVYLRETRGSSAKYSPAPIFPALVRFTSNLTVATCGNSIPLEIIPSQFPEKLFKIEFVKTDRRSMKKKSLISNARVEVGEVHLSVNTKNVSDLQLVFIFNIFVHFFNNVLVFSR